MMVHEYTSDPITCIEWAPICNKTNFWLYGFVTKQIFGCMAEFDDVNAIATVY